MHWRNLFLLTPLSLLLVLSVAACASKKTAHKEVYGPAYDAPEHTGSGTAALPSAKEDVPNAPGDEPASRPSEKERPRVALVVGGNGVASFGLVGLLKRFHEEGIRVEFVVASGWPATLATGFGCTRTVHDLEWLAMRLEESDFSAKAWFGRRKAKFSRALENACASKGLGELRLPLYLSVREEDAAHAEIFDRGDWREGLAHALRDPLASPLDVEEGLRRDARLVVGIGFFHEPLSKEERSEIQQQLKRAHIALWLPFKKSPLDFSARRLAIQTGYREGAKLAKKIRGHYAQPANRNSP